MEYRPFIPIASKERQLAIKWKWPEKPIYRGRPREYKGGMTKKPNEDFLSSLTSYSTSQLTYNDYLKVPETVYNQMKRASSKGDFLNKEIKPNYEFEKIR